MRSTSECQRQRTGDIRSMNLVQRDPATTSEHEPGKLNTPPRETPDRGCPGTEVVTGLDTRGCPRHEAARSYVVTGMVHPSADLTTAGGPVGEWSVRHHTDGPHQISGRYASPCAACFWHQRACIRPTLATKTAQAVRRCQRRAQATRTRQAGAARHSREGRHPTTGVTTANGFYICSRAGCRPAASGRCR